MCFGAHSPILCAVLMFSAVTAAAAGPPPAGAGDAGSAARSQITWDKGFELPPGSHLRFAKVDETGAVGARVLRYRIYATAAQLGTPYVLGVWRIGTSLDDLQVLSETAYVNRKGLVLASVPNPGQQDSDQLNDGSELDVTFQAARGEPVRFILRSPDWKTMIGGTIIPYPIEASDHGCKLSALLSEPDAKSVLVYMDGFPANAVLTAQSAIQGATQEQKAYTDPKGHASVVESPRAKGADSGTMTETVHAPACNVSLSVPWGRGSSAVQ
jgi:hypothetical protein